MLVARREGDIFVAVATIQSAPRPPGASMLVERSVEVAGLISGCCDEGAVRALAREALESGEPGLAPVRPQWRRRLRLHLPAYSLGP